MSRRSVFCCFPDCGRAVYEYDDRGIVNKIRSHTVPKAERKAFVKRLNLNSNNVDKTQLLVCENHFRPGAYLHGSNRLRRDLPYSSLIIYPKSDNAAGKNGANGQRDSVSMVEKRKSVGTSLNSPARRPRIESDSESEVDFGPINQTICGTVSRANHTSEIKAKKPELPDASKNIKCPPKCHNGLSKNDMEIKKFRIEATMKFLHKEKDLQSRLKEKEDQVQSYKKQLENVKNELSDKEKEIITLRSTVDDFKKENEAIVTKISDQVKQRNGIEEKNIILKGDIQFNDELFKVMQERSVKRFKPEETITSTTQAKSDVPIDFIMRLKELEQQLKETNERRENELNFKEKELANMQKEIEVLHAENQQLYDANMTLNMDIRAYRKLIQLEEQRTMTGQRSNGGCLDIKSENCEAELASSSSSR